MFGPESFRLLGAIGHASSGEEVLRAMIETRAPLLDPDAIAVRTASTSNGLEDLALVADARGCDMRRLAIDERSLLARAQRERRAYFVVGREVEAGLEGDAPWAPPGVKALAVLPFPSGRRVEGALGLAYVEPRTFGSEERTVLALIGRQAGMALERAGLLHESRVEAERMRFLADASEILAGTLHLRDTLANVARVAVPRFADWVAVDLLEPTRVHRVAMHHRDPKKVALAWKLFEKYPPRLRPGSRGLSRVLTTGEPAHEFVMTDRILDRASRTPEHRAWLEEIGLSSYLIVPLLVRDEVRGALSFGYAESGRHYRETDVRVAIDLGRRAGMALENARLYDEAERARLELAASKRLFENIAEATPDVLFIFDLQTKRNVYASRQVERMLGYTAADLAAMGDRFLEELIHPDDFPRIHETAAAIPQMADDAMAQTVYRMRHADGSYRWIQDRAVVFARDASGRPRQILGVAHDVTEDRAREEALRRGEERYRLATQAVAGIIYDWDVERNVVELSPGLLDLVGYRPEEVDRTPGWWVEVIVEEDRPEAASSMYRAIHSGAGTFELQYRVRHRDGTIKHVWDRSILHRNAEGAVTRIIGYTLDITDRVRAENRLKESELALREADRRKDEFLAMLAHELRNPLTPIRNAAEVLQMIEPDEGPARRATDILERQVGHMARLVDDLLDVSRITRGKITLRTQELDLADVLRRAVDDARPQFEDLGLTLDVRIPNRRWRVCADATRMAQVIGNLLNNATKFTDRGGQVVVALSEDAEARHVRLCIRDTGIGIEESMLGRIFEPFSQAERGLARTRGGLGLGLALVKGLVDQHGGTVFARSEGPGRGAEFTVELPLLDHSDRMRSESGVEERQIPRALRVLVIEDNQDAAESLRMLLDAIGCRTEVASSGSEGLALARAMHPDAVICDIGLPGTMNGFDVARQLRADPELSALRLIAMSGYGQDDDLRRGREAGFDFYLTKPADLASIERVLEREVG